MYVFAVRARFGAASGSDSAPSPCAFILWRRAPDYNFRRAKSVRFSPKDFFAAPSPQPCPIYRTDGEPDGQSLSSFADRSLCTREPWVGCSSSPTHFAQGSRNKNASPYSKGRCHGVTEGIRGSVFDMVNQGVRRDNPPFTFPPPCFCTRKPWVGERL